MVIRNKYNKQQKTFSDFDETEEIATYFDKIKKHETAGKIREHVEKLKEYKSEYRRKIKDGDTR